MANNKTAVRKVLDAVKADGGDFVGKLWQTLGHPWLCEDSDGKRGHG